MIMNNEQTPSLIDSVRGKMPTSERDVSPGFSRPQSLTRYSHDEPANYSGGCFSYCLSGQEGRDLSPHWNPSRTYLQSGRSPALHQISAGRSLPNQVVYRPEHVAFPVDSNHPLEPQELAAKEKLMTYYDKVAEKPSPSAPEIYTPIAVRQLSAGASTISPQSESPVGLAIPKPVYRHNACCTEHGCQSGRCYSIERRMQRFHPNVYDEELMLQYSPLSFLQRKGHGALMQQRVLQLEHNGSRLPFKEARTEGYHGMTPAGPIRVPAFTEQNYNGFHYGSPTHPILSHSSEQFHNFSSKVYHGMPPPSSCSYEEAQHVTLSQSGIPSKMYMEPVPAPKHTLGPRCPVFYYPQGNMEVSNAAGYADVGGKGRRDTSPPVNKQSAPNPTGQYLVHQPIFSDVPVPCSMAPATHSFHRSYDVSPCIYKMHSGSGQKRTFSEGSGTSLSFQLPDRLENARLTSPRGLCGQALGSGAFHPVRPRFDYGNLGQESIARSSTLASPPLVYKPTSQQEVIHRSSTGYHPSRTSPTLERDESEPATSTCSDKFANKKMKVDNSGIRSKSPSLKQMEENGFCDGEIPHKRPENTDIDKEWLDRLPLPSSPPMPVINNVFSLAPYKVYLEATGVLPQSNVLDSSDPDLYTNQLKPDTQNCEKEATDEPKKFTASACPWSCEDLVKTQEPHTIKKEEITQQDTHGSCEGLLSDLREMGDAKEATDVETDSSESVLDLSVKKSDSGASAGKVLNAMDSPELKVNVSMRHGVGDPILNSDNEKSEMMSLGMKTPPPPDTKKNNFQQIPPQYLKLSAFKIILPDMLRPPCSNAPEVPSPPSGLKSGSEPPAEASADRSRRARHHFMELHQSLCRLISNTVSCSPKEELRTWLDKLEQGEPAKALNVSSVLGTGVRETWLRCTNTDAAYRQVIDQLEDYVSCHQCPFPHVTRAGTLFIPMLVVKEILFPQVPGAFIDQVLQERRVELRPTTLSEERHLTQLQRRSCSSKLRRLLSLKHLPDIYPDVLNLFYHACVKKCLDSTTPAGAQKTAQVTATVKVKRAEVNPEGVKERYGPVGLGICLDAEIDIIVKTEPGVQSEENEVYNEVCSLKTASRSPSPDSPKRIKIASCFKKLKREGRRKSGSKRTFVGKDISPLGDNKEYIKKSENWSIVESFSQEGSQSSGSENSENVNIKMEEDYSDVDLMGKEVAGGAWGTGTSDDLSPGNSDAETDRASTRSSQSQSPESSGSRSGMILKLRKVLFNTVSGSRDGGYQAVWDAGSLGQTGRSGFQGGRREEKKGDENRVVGGKTQTRVTQGNRKGVEALRSPRRSPKTQRLHGSLLRIKYCPYLSVGYSSQHRRRWVLRSAVQTARRAMKNCYPELVGKRICHLYEEKDKSEVWYRGLVLRVHEPHPNPLKTVFEVKYDSEPEWQYYLELLIDYKKGWLKVED